MSALQLIPLTQRQAREFVGRYHRHNLPPRGDIIRVGLQSQRTIVAVGMAGRPVARGLDDGTTIEITRICTLGTPNAASRLYGALCRAAKALGYTSAITYTLASEPGSSPRAAGFEWDADVPIDSWERPNRARYQQDLFGNNRRPTEPKIRWRKGL